MIAGNSRLHSRSRTKAPSRLRLVVLFASFSLSLGACSKDKAEVSEGEVEETGVDPSKSPFGALKQLAEAGKEMQAKAEKMQEHKPVNPVKFDALVPLLPSPSGWEKSGDARAETTQMGEFQISTATQKYEQAEGADRKTMKVTIVDGSYVPMVYAPFLMMSKFSREGTDGHSKGLEVDGHPSFEEWKKNSKTVTLTILVKDRFLVTIEGRQVDEKEARAWAKYIPLDKLKKWAEDEVTGDQVSPPPAETKEKEAEGEKGAEKAAPADVAAE